MTSVLTCMEHVKNNYDRHVKSLEKQQDTFKKRLERLEKQQDTYNKRMDLDPDQDPPCRVQVLRPPSKSCLALSMFTLHKSHEIVIEHAPRP